MLEPLLFILNSLLKENVLSEAPLLVKCDGATVVGVAAVVKEELSSLPAVWSLAVAVFLVAEPLEEQLI